MCSRLVLILIAMLPWFVHGATPETNVVTVGVYAHEPLVSVHGDGTEVEGLFVDILKGLAARKGWQLHYVAGSAAEGMERLEQGTNLDLLMPVAWPDARTARQDVTGEGLVSSRGQIYVPESILVTSLSDLAGKTVAVIRGDPYYAGFRVMLSDAHVRCDFVEMDTYRQIFESLDRGRVDAGLVDRFFGEQYASRYKVTSSFVASPTVEFRFAAPGNRKGTIIKDIDAWQTALRADRHSLYYRSLQRWTDNAERMSFAIPSLLCALLLLTGGGTVALRRLHTANALQVERLVASNRDLHKTSEEQTRREGVLEAQGMWWHTLLDSTEDVILVHGLDAKHRPTKFVEVNRTACIRMEYTREELLALSPRDIEVGSDSGPHPLYASLLDQWNHQLAARNDAEPNDGQVAPPQLTSERVYRTKYGTDIPMEVTVRVLTHDGRPVIFYSAHDITHRRETLFALQESERRFHDFFARSPIGIALYDASRKLTDVNQSALAMFGVSDRNLFAMQNLFEAPGLQAEARQALIEGSTVRYEAVLDFDRKRTASETPSTRSGKCFFDVLITNLRLDRDFSPKGFLVMLQDITEHRRAEEALRQNERMLRQAHKMEAIGTLAGGVAHDFNNILTPIIGYTEMALLSCSSEGSVQSNLEEVLKASHRAKDLVKQILMFSRQTEHEEKPIRLIPVINEVTTLLRGSIMPNVELHCELRTERDIVRADATQMHQVLMNLGANALHAMKAKGGTLEIGLRLITVDSHSKEPLSRLRRGTYVDLSVRDTGTGMDRATQERIFEPFFTTKASGEGTGMGLAVVHGIITALRGTITVDSELGKGSVFHVILPLLEQAAEQVSGPAAPIPRGTETVLFVDDEADIVTMAEQMLRTLGYMPVTCLRSQEALALFQENPDRFQLLVTDQVMPLLTGMELVREIHRVRPELPALLCTGFSRTASDQELLDGGISEILMKPIVLRQLAETMRRVLDSKPSTPPDAG